MPVKFFGSSSERLRQCGDFIDSVDVEGRFRVNGDSVDGASRLIVSGARSNDRGWNFLTLWSVREDAVRWIRAGAAAWWFGEAA